MSRAVSDQGAPRSYAYLQDSIYEDMRRDPAVRPFRGRTSQGTQGDAVFVEETPEAVRRPRITRKTGRKVEAATQHLEDDLIFHSVGFFDQSAFDAQMQYSAYSALQKYVAASSYPEELQRSLALQNTAKPDGDAQGPPTAVSGNPAGDKSQAIAQTQKPKKVPVSSEEDLGQSRLCQQQSQSARTATRQPAGQVAVSSTETQPELDGIELIPEQDNLALKKRYDALIREQRLGRDPRVYFSREFCVDVLLQQQLRDKIANASINRYGELLDVQAAAASNQDELFVAMTQDKEARRAAQHSQCDELGLIRPCPVSRMHRQLLELTKYQPLRERDDLDLAPINQIEAARSKQRSAQEAGIAFKQLRDELGKESPRREQPKGYDGQPIQLGYISQFRPDSAGREPQHASQFNKSESSWKRLKPSKRSNGSLGAQPYITAQSPGPAAPAAQPLTRTEIKPDDAKARQKRGTMVTMEVDAGEYEEYQRYRLQRLAEMNHLDFDADYHRKRAELIRSAQASPKDKQAAKPASPKAAANGSKPPCNSKTQKAHADRTRSTHFSVPPKHASPWSPRQSASHVADKPSSPRGVRKGRSKLQRSPQFGDAPIKKTKSPPGKERISSAPRGGGVQTSPSPDRKVVLCSTDDAKNVLLQGLKHQDTQLSKTAPPVPAPEPKQYQATPVAEAVPSPANLVAQKVKREKKAFAMFKKLAKK